MTTRDYLRKIRNGGVLLLFYLDAGKAKIGVINTILLVITVVAVLELNDTLIFLLGAGLFIGMILFGYVQDKTGVISKGTEIKALRNPIMMKLVKNQEKILEDIREIRSKLEEESD